MKRPRHALIVSAFVLVFAGTPDAVFSDGVPIAGFSPLVGLSLTNKFDPDSDPSFTFFQADLESSLVGTQLGQGGTPFYDVALLDIGAAVSLITADADASFGMSESGFRHPDANLQQIGGATGTIFADIDDPLGMFAIGLGHRTNANNTPLNFNAGSPSLFKGQSSVSILTLPAESTLPNVIGIPFISQYATYIRNDQPQIFQQGGRTVRAPQIEFLPLGSGGQGITRRAPIQLESADAFNSPPLYVFDLDNLFDGTPLTEHPQAPTVLQEPGALFLSVSVENDGEELNNFQFFFDTGADVTVVSELNATRLGFDPVLDEPDFTVAVIGSAGTTENVPGFFVDQFTIQAIGGSVTLQNVPVIVLDVTNPADPGNVVDGIVGTNLLSGRNLVLDPKPSLGGGGVGPSLYISDPVTTAHSWSTVAASANWATTTNWNVAGTPDVLWIANANNISGTPQEAVVSTSSTVWELNVSGNGAATMSVRVQSGARLTTFSGVNLKDGGQIRLQSATLDAHFVDIRGGTLIGSGTVVTGSGPIPGQVENLNGTVAPGDGVGTLNIIGRFSNGSGGTLTMEVGGLTPGSGHDQLVVTGAAALDGTLSVSLVNSGSFTAGVGDTFTLLTTSEGLGGSFKNLLLPLGFNWRVEYEPSSVNLIVGIPGDYNDDGTVNAADYTVWRNALGTSNQHVDGDGSGMVDANDYLIWKNHYGQTGSGAATGGLSNVPEPASTLMCLVAVTLLASSAQRRRIR